MKKVSICIPVYEPEEEFISLLIDSVCNQTLLPDELILTVDSDSEKVVPRVLRGRSWGSIALRVVENSDRLGMTQNWNAAVSYSSGDWILLPGQDDILEPNAVLTLLTWLASEPKHNVDCLVCGQSFVNEHGLEISNPSKGVTRYDLLRRSGQSDWISPRAAVALALCYGQVFSDPCGMWFSRSGFDKVGGFSSLFPHSADIDYMLKCAIASDGLEVSSTVISHRRIHGSNITSSNVKTGTARADRERLVDNYAPLLPSLRGLDHVGSREIESRAVARLLTHCLFDSVVARSTRIGRRGLYEHGGGTRRKQLVQEVAEILRCVKPQGRYWVGE